ncbi:MAG: hypothetical protein JSV68_14775 [Anaerolineaceae bacterium]|jgi:hypothetical protein|nr:hypothetical protein [Chloroflexota bacterium]UCC50363.1 MAG: hypothetical protein JSV68_14775 [Anaerolineaceae bacterium]
MSIPVDNPVIQFLFWLLHTPGIGGVAVILVGLGSVLVYTLTLVWIRAGRQVGDADTYAYPTPSLIHPHERGSE